MMDGIGRREGFSLILKLGKELTTKVSRWSSHSLWQDRLGLVHEKLTQVVRL